MFDSNALIHEMSNLKKFALKLTRNESDADDLTQATVLRALEKRDLFQAGTSLFSWASKIMYNLFVSDYRRKVKFETQYDPESYIDSQSIPACQENNLELLRVDEAINTLSADHKEILVMVCVKGIEYAEVAKILDIPIGTVRSRLSRARDSLQLLLDTPKAPVSVLYPAMPASQSKVAA